jgi:hypothetical protein
MLDVFFKEPGYLTQYKCQCGLVKIRKDMCSQCFDEYDFKNTDNTYSNIFYEEDWGNPITL